MNEVSESQRLNNLPDKNKITEWQIWNLISVTSDFEVYILSALFSLTQHGVNKKLLNQKYYYEFNINLYSIYYTERVGFC